MDGQEDTKYTSLTFQPVLPFASDARASAWIDRLVGPPSPARVEGIWIGASAHTGSELTRSFCGTLAKKSALDAPSNLIDRARREGIIAMINLVLPSAPEERSDEIKEGLGKFSASNLPEGVAIRDDVAVLDDREIPCESFVFAGCEVVVLVHLEIAVVLVNELNENRVLHTLPLGRSADTLGIDTDREIDLEEVFQWSSRRRAPGPHKPVHPDLLRL